MTSSILFADRKTPDSHNAIRAIRSHEWIYPAEAALLALAMISACAFTALFEYPNSPVHRAIPSRFVRRALLGMAMGLTAIALVYSRWGKRYGAHDESGDSRETPCILKCNCLD